jgi:hypothetical protein
MGPVSAVAIDSLLHVDSPRLAGEDPEHTRRLAEVEADLPPILVHRGTLRVIDGMHRVRAAQLNGRDTIQARFFCGDEAFIFPLAVKANIQHGLPLTLADREAAAARMLAEKRDWSDRAIAALTGLSAWTVKAIRGRTPEDSPEPPARVGLGPEDSPEPPARVGLDGRVRPLDAEAGRHLASQIIAARPGASLREVAKAAGISPNTARDVRQRMSRGEDPVPAGRRGRQSRVAPADRGANVGRPATTGGHVAQDLGAVLARLRRDPSIQSNQTGRDLLRWLSLHARILADRQPALRAVPPHQASAVAQLVTCWAHQWLEFAGDLERRLLTEDQPT